jgi:hypothetical protein
LPPCVCRAARARNAPREPILSRNLRQTGATGKSLRLVSSLKGKNILLYSNSDLRYQPPRLAPTEGRFAIVTIRRARDAMDAAVSGGFFPPDENACSVRRNRVVLAPRPWRYAGGSFPPATGARKAASPGRARISRKTIARGKPGCLGCTCSLKTRVLSFATFARGSTGAVGARLSLRPLIPEGQRICKAQAKIVP